MSLAVSRRTDFESLVEEGYLRSVALLRRNTGPEGILACTPGQRARERCYESVFGRDAAICALGMFASGEPDLVASARQSLRTLARHQAKNGQIPKFVNPALGETDFWYTGCIDATLWWLIAVRIHDRFFQTPRLQDDLGGSVERAWQWLSCQEHPGWYLLQQNEASDWADIMPRSGFVLYTNALWFWAKRLYGVPSAHSTRDFANALFYPHQSAPAEHRRIRLLADYIRTGGKESEFYLSFVNFSFWGEEVDTFANVLAALTGIAGTAGGKRIVSALMSLGVHRPWPLRVVGTPIDEDHSLWRSYMARHDQNYPFQYHNGGCWPFVGGFWVLLLARLGMTESAWSELEQLALVNQQENWQFNEWFHGISGIPMGMPGQSWNAGMYILAWHSLHGGLDLFG